MKKIFLSLILLSITVAGFSQQAKKPAAAVQQTVPVKIDSLVTVSLPTTYQTKDTLTQRIYSANRMYGFMTVIRTANEKNNTPLKKEKDLKKVFSDYIAKIQTQSASGRAIRVRDTTVGTLEAKNFTLKSNDGADNVQVINFTLIYTQDATYTLEYVYPEIRTDLVKDEYKAFISSIRLSPELQRNDQYLSKDNGLSQVAKIGIYAGGAIVLVLLIVLIAKRRKNLAY